MFLKLRSSDYNHRNDNERVMLAIILSRIKMRERDWSKSSHVGCN